MTLRAFVDEVAAALPPTAVGARVSGDLDASVQTVGLVGGSGDFMLEGPGRRCGRLRHVRPAAPPGVRGA